MLDKEDLQAIAQLLSDAISPIYMRLDSIEERLIKLEDRVTKLEDKMSRLENRISSLEAHIENYTDKSIQLLAENFVELTKKLNEAIPAANATIAYQVKVSYLEDKVAKLEQDIKELKDRIA